MGDVQQYITPAVGGTYDLVRAMVAVGDADADMTVKIKRTSDNVQFGSTETLTVADFADLAPVGSFAGIEYRLWEQVLVSPATLSTVQYYVEYDSAATEPWRVIYLDASASYPGNATFNGATDFLLADGGTKLSADAPVTLSESVLVTDAPSPRSTKSN